MYYLMDSEGNQTIVCIEQDSNLHSFIPVDESNTDYQAYLAWVAEKNTPLPWPPE